MCSVDSAGYRSEIYVKRLCRCRSTMLSPSLIVTPASCPLTIVVLRFPSLTCPLRCGLYVSIFELLPSRECCTFFYRRCSQPFFLRGDCLSCLAVVSAQLVLFSSGCVLTVGRRSSCLCLSVFRSQMMVLNGCACKGVDFHCFGHHGGVRICVQ